MSLPVRAPGARVELIDALRAFALIGILQVNVLSFVWGPTGLTVFAVPPTVADQAAVLLIGGFVSTKFIALFAFLFGLGFALQMKSLRRATGDAWAARAIYKRRLWALLAIGVAHGVLLYFGDILTAYALCGFVLLLYARARPATLARAAAWWLGAYVLLGALLMLGLELLLPPLPADEALLLPEDVIERFSAYAGSGYAEQLPLRVFDYFYLTSLTMLLAAPFIVGLFVLGALAGRLGWLTHPERHPRVWAHARQIGWAALPLAAIGAWLGLRAQIETPGWMSVVGYTLTSFSFPLAALYLAWIVAQRDAPPVRAAIRWLAPAGRMPLTNYLLQSVAMGALLSGWGLGWGAELGAAQLSLLAFAIVAVQLVASRWWIARVGQGPVEALWRRVTYGGR